MNYLFTVQGDPMSLSVCLSVRVDVRMIHGCSYHIIWENYYIIHSSPFLDDGTVAPLMMIQKDDESKDFCWDSRMMMPNADEVKVLNDDGTNDTDDDDRVLIWWIYIIFYTRKPEGVPMLLWARKLNRELRSFFWCAGSVTPMMDKSWGVSRTAAAKFVMPARSKRGR